MFEQLKQSQQPMQFQFSSTIKAQFPALATCFKIEYMAETIHSRRVAFRLVTQNNFDCPNLRAQLTATNIYIYRICIFIHIQVA